MQFLLNYKQLMLLRDCKEEECRVYLAMVKAGSSLRHTLITFLLSQQILFDYIQIP